MKKLLSLNLWIFFILILNSACETDDFAAAIKEKIRVDTLTNNLIIEMRPELDSLCELKKVKLIDLAVDSIMPIRIQEIEEMLRN